MELEDFIKNFAEQFYETDESDIKADTMYHDLAEWSSMMALAIIAMVDECYEKSLTAADIRDSKTVEDLFNIIKEK